MRKAFSSALIAGLAAASVHDLPEFGDDWEQNNTLGFNYCDADKNGTVDYFEFKHCV